MSKIDNKTSLFNTTTVKRTGYAGATQRIRTRNLDVKQNTNGPKTKEQKRVEAKEWNAIYAATHGLKDRLTEINEELTLQKARLKEIEEILADPTFYTTRNDSPEIIKEHGQIKQEIEKLEDEWLEISVKMDWYNNGIKL